MNLEPPLTHDEFLKISHAEKLKLAVKYHDSFWECVNGKDPHGTEFMDQYFLRKHEHEIKGFGDKQKLEIANMDDYMLEAVKESHSFEEESLKELSKALGVELGLLKNLAFEDASDELKLKLVNYLLDSSIVDPIISCEILYLLKQDDTLHQEYKLHTLNYFYQAMSKEDVSDTWQEIMKSNA